VGALIPSPFAALPTNTTHYLEENMQVKLMVERGQDECVVKLAGTHYKFIRNEHGDLIAEVSDLQTIKFVSDPRNSSFMPYSGSKTIIEAGLKKPAGMPDGVLIETQIVDEVFDEKVTFTEEPPPEGLPLHEQVGSDAYAPHVGQVDETTPALNEAQNTPVSGEVADAPEKVDGAEVAPSTGEFVCPECGKDMKSAQRLQGHMGGVHRGK
jgi:hypothetical protein